MKGGFFLLPLLSYSGIIPVAADAITPVALPLLQQSSIEQSPMPQLAVHTGNHVTDEIKLLIRLRSCLNFSQYKCYEVFSRMFFLTF